MNNLDPNARSMSMSDAFIDNFVRGKQLTPDQAQSMIDNGEGDNVHKSNVGYFYEKVWMDGRHSESNFDAASVSEESEPRSDETVSVSTRSHPDSIKDAVSHTHTATDMELSPEAEKLEQLANQLESAADELKARYNNAAVNAFEAAAGKVARAAEEVRENPGSEAAVEEFETATDELKNAAHALEGDIGNEQYQKIVSAVDDFETSTDHLLAADDGEAEMAGAMSKAYDALESLVEATTGRGLPDKGDVRVADTYTQLDKLSNEINSLISRLMDKLGVDDAAAAPAEEAAEQLEDAVDKFIANPSSESSIEGLEKATDTLKNALTELKGKVDESAYQDMSNALNGLEETVDKLSGLDGQPSKVDNVASEIAQALKEVVKAISDGIEGGTTATKPAESDKIPESTLIKLKEVLEELTARGQEDILDTLLPDTAFGRTSNAESDKTTGTDNNSSDIQDVVDAKPASAPAEVVKATTDVVEQGGSNTVGNIEPPQADNLRGGHVSGQQILDHLQASKEKNEIIRAGLEKYNVSDKESFDQLLEKDEGFKTWVEANHFSFLSDQEVLDEIKEMEEINERYGDEMEPSDVSVNTDDLSGRPFPGNTGVVTPDVINDDIIIDPFPLPMPPVFSSGADSVEAMATNLKRSAIDIAGNLNVPELNQFEATVDRLEAAADGLAMTPQDEGAVNEFKAAAKELQEVTHALDGKIQGSTYEKAASAVDELVKAAESLRTAENGTKIRINNNPALNDAAMAISKLDNVVNFDIKSDSGPIFDDAIPYIDTVGSEPEPGFEVPDNLMAFNEEVTKK